MSKILIVGAGYVGIATGIVYFKHGHEVYFYDLNESKINEYKTRKLSFYEPGVFEHISNINEKYFVSSLDLVDTLPEFVFICVNTPSNDDGSVSIDALIKAVKDIFNKYDHSYTLIIKSTIPPGTCKLLKEFIPNNVTLINNPEFLSQGTSIHDAFCPNRIVVGKNENDNIDQFMELLSIYKYRCKIVVTNHESAELAKYASNAFLALKISFINEMLQICENVDANIEDVSKIMGLDPRIGHQFLKSGSGFGGPCFKKDVSGLAKIEEQYGIENGFAKLTNEFNEKHKEHLVDVLIKRHGSIKGLKICVTGLTYKLNTSSAMNAPSLKIIERLIKEGAIVYAYDELVNKDEINIEFIDYETTLKECDHIVDCLGYKIIK